MKYNKRVFFGELLCVAPEMQGVENIGSYDEIKLGLNILFPELIQQVIGMDGLLQSFAELDLIFCHLDMWVFLEDVAHELESLLHREK